MIRLKAKAIGIIFVLLMICSSSSVFAKQSDEEQEIRSFLQKLYDVRADFLLNGDERLLSGYYLEQGRTSQYAKGLELHRSKYVRMWAERRNLKFIAAEPSIRISRIKKEGGFVRASVVQSLKLTYQYNESGVAPQHFGVGTRHSLKLQKNGDGWFVLNEWYLDPFDENPDLIPAQERKSNDPDTSALRSPDVPSLGKKSVRHFNREQAIDYANNYAGAAWGAGNENRYNRKYRDYTGSGGDCTNFVSQVLGDPEGGGIPMTHGWRYLKGSGSVHWVRTDKFKQFILYSGYGRLVAKGTYSEIMKPMEHNPQGAFNGLLPGDLIAYELAGDIDHFAIFMGFDNNGYPLVNCHTVDRFRAPFDLGWDKTTRYWLIHIK